MTVKLDQRGSIATLTVDRQAAGNRLDVATISELSKKLTALTDAEAMPSVVILASEGPDFSLGREPADGELTPQGLITEFGRIQALNELVQNAPFVTMAVVQGRAFGAGLSLASRCDFVVAAADARLSFPEVAHGIPPTIVLSHYRYVLPRKVLLDLILTGREIDGHEGLRMGLVSRVVAADRLISIAAALAAEIASHNSRTLHTIKRFLKYSEGLDPRDAPNLGIQMYANELVDRKYREGGTN